MGRAALAVIGVLLSASACTDYTATRRPQIESIALHSGDEQGADVGQQLAEPLAVIARSTAGEPMAGVEVVWLAGQGGNVVPLGVTGSDGVARAVRTLGASLGEYHTVAQAIPLVGQAVVFTSYGRIDGGYRVGNRTIGPLTDTTLGTNDQPLVVMVTNEKDEPVPGFVVTWTTSGDGSVSASTQPTDAGGESVVYFTYGPTAGMQVVYANAEGLIGTPIPFAMRGTAGNAVAIEKVAGDGLSAPAGGQVIHRVIARDARGNPRNGVAIHWSVGGGGGSITPSQNFTGDDGTAEALRTLGPNAGTHTAVATAPDVAGAPAVTFSTTALAALRRQ